jgi:hypothetical protein
MKLISGLILLISRKDLNMLNQISLKPIMDVATAPKMPPLPLAQPTHSENPVLVIDVVIPLFLNDHVVHDHTSSHHISHSLWASSSSSVPNNTPP